MTALRRGGEPRSLQCLQFFTGLKTHCLPWRNGDLRTGTGVPANAGLSGPYVEDAKAAQFDSLSLRKGTLHTFEDSFHCHLGLRFGYPGAVHHFVDDVQFNQVCPLAIARTRLAQFVSTKDTG